MPNLMWFSRDLRLHDNPALQLAADSDMLLCVFVVDPNWFRPGRFQSKAMGGHRWHFLWQSLMALDASLKSRGQRLHIAWGNPVEVIPALCRKHGISNLVRSRMPGTEEASQWQQVVEAVPEVQCLQVETLSLFHELDLPFMLEDLPDSFTQFRKQLEKPPQSYRTPVGEPVVLPPSPGLADDDRDACPPVPDVAGDARYEGGEAAGLAQLEAFLFGTNGIATYKETRNTLDDWSGSSRFSPWLANGSLSVRQVASEIARYEQEVVGNESTYWLYFELLWREYFYWYGLRHGARIFCRDGVKNRARAISFYPHRFRAWCDGSTEYPIVNACMNQLRETGYMSNRGRQLVASCFVHELGLDWRYGAAWFEEQLVDYDPASNYGNWQYLAGVGADPRRLRRFDLDKQTRQYDPDGAFIARWKGHAEQPVGLHTVDAADWPIPPQS